MSKDRMNGILANTDRIIDKCLLGDADGKRHYWQAREGKKLDKPLPGFVAKTMLQALLEQIGNNLKQRDRDAIGNSIQNWRKEIQPNLDAKNKSKEVRLERKIALALKSKERNDWWNQMPIASGLIDSDADRRRAIDLVHRRNDDGTSFDFIELKIDSDTPLFALMEIVLYGLVYLVLRNDRDWLPECSRGAGVFKAQEIGLCVLAPKQFYRGYKLGWLEHKLTAAFSLIIKNMPLEKLTITVSSHWPTQFEEWDESVLSDETRLNSILERWTPEFSSWAKR